MKTKRKINTRTSLTMIELSCIYLVDSRQQLLKQILRKSTVLNRLWTGHTFLCATLSFSVK